MTNSVLIVGRGGREHALAWKLAQSDQVAQIFVAPGNGGTATAGGKIENIAISEDDIDELISFAGANDVSLTVIGPEAPLVDGIVDCFENAGLRCFGPVAGAARLEASKSFAKHLMARVGIATAEYTVATDYEDALAHVRSVSEPIVIKASGLAAGKGVVVPNSLAESEQALQRIMVDREFGEAGDEVIIEQRLEGQEATILAFCDGTTIVPMPAAQDHAPLLEGDQGPNTGGMGAYAPTPLVDAALENEVVETVLKPMVRALALDGYPYVGVLYAGLMLTDDGPKVLEFNCRFGDPEAQVILPLLRGDLYEILVACIEGTLDRVPVDWDDAVAATIVAATEGYPTDYGKGSPISGIAEAESIPGVTVFHAGTAVDGDLVTNGGRVLAVTGVEPNLSMALACAYHGIEHISFQGMQYRHDIGARIAGVMDADGGSIPLPKQMTDAGFGVGSAAGSRAEGMVRRALLSTYGPEVVAAKDATGAMYDAADLGDDPVLVASTVGLGAKTRVAITMSRYDTIGHDLVNCCINDILARGARPLFFQDHLTTNLPDPLIAATVIGGIAAACRRAGCALLGGQTEQRSDYLKEDGLELVGTVVGVVPKDGIIDRAGIRAGDAVLGLRSSGLHSNGYSSAMQVLEHWDLEDRVAALGTSLGNALLEPHRSYLKEITRLGFAGVGIQSLVHVSSGGLIGSSSEALPDELALRIDLSTWTAPPLFALLQSQGNIADQEMFSTFNMGVGLLAVVNSEAAAIALQVLGPDAWRIGEIVSRDGQAVVLS
jgi:phosphoribosylamine--glycine ligase/phosphoribosylaminoimidazole synthetase